MPKKPTHYIVSSRILDAIRCNKTSELSEDFLEILAKVNAGEANIFPSIKEIESGAYHA